MSVPAQSLRRLKKENKSIGNNRAMAVKHGKRAKKKYMLPKKKKKFMLPRVPIKKMKGVGDYQ